MADQIAARSIRASLAQTCLARIVQHRQGTGPDLCARYRLHRLAWAIRRSRLDAVSTRGLLCLKFGMDNRHMIPLGYMLKTVIAPAPEWVGAPAVKAVHSVSNCVSSDFGDYIKLWKHNGWWFFDTPEAALDAAASMGVQTDAMSLFYYEAFEKQWDDEAKSWAAFAPEDFPTQITLPASATLSGFDVVPFTVGTSPECSPLSCNGLATPLGANQFCLFDNFGQAFDAVEQARFHDSEPGPCRIISVYSVGR